jgi:hypothetical protein
MNQGIISESPDRISVNGRSYYYNGSPAVSFYVFNDGNFITRTQPENVDGVPGGHVALSRILLRYNSLVSESFKKDNAVEVSTRSLSVLKRMNHDAVMDHVHPGRIYLGPKIVTFYSDLFDLFPWIDVPLQKIFKIVGKDINRYSIEYWLKDANYNKYFNDSFLDKWGSGHDYFKSSGIFVPYPKIKEFLSDLSGTGVKHIGLEKGERHFMASQGVSNPVTPGTGSYLTREISKNAGFNTPAEFHDAHPFESVHHGNYSVVENILGLGDQDVDKSEFTDKPPHKDEVIDHGSGVVQEYKDGDERWYKNDKLHRDGDLPAVIWADGTQEWYKDGKLHRDGDKPAVIEADGTQEWYQNGKPHRDGDKPAVILPDGTQYWYKDGKLYRDGDKPAVIRADGTQEWYRNGVQYK